MSSIDPRERAASKLKPYEANFYDEGLKRSEEFRKDYFGRLNVVKSSQMPMERSRHGLIKHIINEKMDTKECCIDMYQQFIPPGKATGIHRHLSEEVMYVVEGHGYDLHWDVRFDCDHEMEFTWDEEPKRFEWSMGDVIYVPPYCAHQSFNSDPKNEARIIVMNSRVLKPMGFDWIEQVKDAEGY
jgi:uncharacterized RmlC-like cupin family protein